MRRRFPRRPAPKSKGGSSGQIARINDLSKTTRATWFSLLGYLAFVGVTLLGVQDADFFDTSRQTQLPIINISIPTASFFVVAPILGTALHVYLHLYLIRLWDALAEPDPKVNSVNLSELVTPWLVTDFAIAMRNDGAIKYRTMYWVSHLVTSILVFAAAPLIMLGFWARHWPSHAWGGNLILAFLAAGTIATSLASYATARWRLRHKTQFSGGAWHLLGLIPWALVFLIFALISTLKTEGLRQVSIEDETYAIPIAGTWGIPVPNFLVAWHRPDHVYEQPLFGLAKADLSEKDLSQRPANWQEYDVAKREFTINWCRSEDVPIALCRDVLNSKDEISGRTSAKTSFCERRSSTITPDGCGQSVQRFRYQFVLDWKDQRLQDLKRIPVLNLSGADLRGANLQNSFLAGAKLDNTDFRGANLDSANLEGVTGVATVFSTTQDDETSLLKVKMQNAVLIGPKMAGLYFSTFGRFDNGTIQEYQDSNDDDFVATFQSSNFENWNFSGAQINADGFGDAYAVLANFDFATVFSNDIPEMYNSSTNWAFFNLMIEEEGENELFQNPFAIISFESKRRFIGNCDLFSRNRMEEIALSINDNPAISMNGWNCSWGPE